MRLLIVRHGETEWNTQRLTQGMSDTQLTDRGRRQLKRLSFRLRSSKIHAIYTSPLARAKESGEIVAKYRRWDVLQDDNLREIAFGEWEGKTFDTIREIYPAELDLWTTVPQQCVIPNGESLDAVADRVADFLRYTQERHQRHTIMAVTHSVPAKLLVALSIGLPIQNLHSLRMDNASLTIIDFNAERPLMRLFNDTTHLHEGVTFPR